MNKENCPKCNAKRMAGSFECQKCGVIFAKVEAAQKKKMAPKQPQPAKEQAVQNNKPKKNIIEYTSNSRINKQLYELGTIDTWFTKKEVKYLPEVIQHNEIIKGLGSGLLDGNTWLIVVTNQRLLFLDKGMVFGLKQAEMHYEQISAISYKLGLILASIKISTSGGEKEISQVQKTDAPKLTQLISKLIRESKQPTQQSRPVKKSAPTTSGDDIISQLERLGKLLSDGILTKEEFNSQKTKLLNG